MVIFRDTRRYELTITEHDGAWLATLQAFVPGRLYPTCHLRREVSTREEAVAALIRTWKRLFPTEEPLRWREPEGPIALGREHRARRSEGREA